MISSYIGLPTYKRVVEIMLKKFVGWCSRGTSRKLHWSFSRVTRIRAAEMLCCHPLHKLLLLVKARRGSLWPGCLTLPLCQLFVPPVSA